MNALFSSNQKLSFQSLSLTNPTCQCVPLPTAYSGGGEMLFFRVFYMTQIHQRDTLPPTAGH